MIFIRTGLSKQRYILQVCSVEYFTFHFVIYGPVILGTGNMNVCRCEFWFHKFEDLVFMYRGADKSLARPTSRCILFDGENISFDASLVLYIYIYIVLIFLQLL